MEQQKLNPAMVYVLSIVGLLCCCFGGLGVFLSGPAFFMAKNGLKKASENPDDYDQTSVNSMNTAKIVALIITIICAITLLYNIYDLSTGGFEERKQFIDEFMRGLQEGKNDV
ncbi:CCC motif membrane protein [uncultured Winogradskyella sp.]|uniref:CCC motif membrane protein n=1 Tax=uncultured Winogradskyella sp. TaxID=395353 RepID=UPI0026162677|nr:CCC motif membrane protein [uncultured Winogradskyella sp.]